MARLTRGPSTLGASSRPGAVTAPGTRACQGYTTWLHGHSSRINRGLVVPATPRRPPEDRTARASPPFTRPGAGASSVAQWVKRPGGRG